MRPNRAKTENMTRKEFFEYISISYGIEPDYPFKEDFVSAVFRRTDNKKWFAIAMNVPAEKLAKNMKGRLDIVNFKCDPLLLELVVKKEGFYPAYHMNKRHWITAVLSEALDNADEIKNLVGLSFELTK